MSKKITIIDDDLIDVNSNQNYRRLPSLQSNHQIESSTDSRETVRRAISQLFKDFIMTKTHQYSSKEFGSFGIYKARVETYTAGGEKFIVAFVPDDDFEIGTNRMLSSLKWTNFQTRETRNAKKEFNNLYLQEQIYKRDNVPLLQDRIRYIKTSNSSYVYAPENLQMKIELIPVKEDDNFPEEGTVEAAINLFTTVITI